MQTTDYRSQMSISGIKVPYTVKRNHKARRIWIRVEDEEGLVVVLPKSRKGSVVPKVIREHKDWVLKAIHKREERLENAPPPLGEGRSMVYRGRIVDLRVRNIPCQVPLVKLNGDQISVTMPKNSEKSLREVLSDWMKERALLIFSRRVEYFSTKIGVRYGNIQVRNQKTRWGSCSSKGQLSFNWRLLLAPPDVLDYLVIHEVSHLKHHDHSQRFWNLVKSLCPGYRKHQLWLKENALSLRT
jgi:predicted metal-dependent hydrolase